MKSPELQLIHRDAVCSLYFDPELPGSYAIWHGFAASADFRAICMRSLELSREKRIYKSISDARNMRVISLADQRWLAEEFLPLAMDLGISSKYYSGTIMPQDFFGRQSLDSVTEQVYDVMAAQYKDVQSFTRYFDNYDDARAWLLTVDAPGNASETAQQATTARADEAAQAEAA